MSAELANKPPVFQLKASLYTLTTLHLLEADLQTLHEQLTKLRQQAPKFFNSAPVIVDFQRLTPAPASFDFEALKNLLTGHQLIIVGLRHLSDAWKTAATDAGFAILPNAAQGKSSGARSAELPAAKPLQTQPEKKEKSEPPQTTTSEPVTSADNESSSADAVIVTQPVRSGQQIYAKDADLIVTNSVSPGAEIIADGNIHVYGSLKGRALAGAKGNTEARIFCQSLSAELVSIAGHYWLHEDVIERMKGKKAVQVFLQNEKLQLAEL